MIKIIIVREKSIYHCRPIGQLDQVNQSMSLSLPLTRTDNLSFMKIRPQKSCELISEVDFCLESRVHTARYVRFDSAYQKIKRFFFERDF